MSKKPSAKKTVETWDSLVAKHDTCLENLEPIRGYSEFAKEFGPLMDEGLKKETATLIKSITLDVKAIVNEINETAAMHSGKGKDGEVVFYKGKVPDTDRATGLVMEINARYIDIANKQTALLSLPMEQLATIRDQLIEKVKQDQPVTQEKTDE